MSTTVAIPSTADVARGRRHATVTRPTRDERYPLSRFALQPIAAWVAWYLAPTRLRPVHVTIAGGAAALLAAVLVGSSLGPPSVAAVFVLAAWFCDRLDGELARRQGTVTAWGAWLDANLDELADLGLHVAVAAAAAAELGTLWPWGLLVLFVAGKYLFMYGLSVEPTAPASVKLAAGEPSRESRSLLRDLYHLPANADVRVHGLVLALAWNALFVELIWVAAYYNLRWIARYVLVARRLREGHP